MTSSQSVSSKMKSRRLYLQFLAAYFINNKVTCQQNSGPSPQNKEAQNSNTETLQRHSS